MTKLDIDKYRDDYAKSLEWGRPFYLERPAVFSPAAAAQEGHGACAMMWRFISVWVQMEFRPYA